LPAGGAPDTRWIIRSALLVRLLAVLHGGAGTTVAAADWPVYLGDAASSRYSELAQLPPDNIARLEPAWVHHRGDALPEGR
jgi:glucose dehydrogenase